MIEILIAIGIIVVLLGIVAFSVHHVIGGAKGNDTRARLESLAGMLTEYETAAGMGLKKQPSRMYLPTGDPPTVYPPSPTGNPQLDIWRDADPRDNDDSPTPNPQPLDAPGSVTLDSFKAGVKDRIRSQAVHNTQVVMGLMAKVAACQEMLGKLPDAALLKNPNAGAGTAGLGNLTLNATKAAFSPAILVDSWDNPIIFVPASGLAHVNVGGVVVRITSAGNVQDTATGSPARPTPANARPFFASAGQDGNFSTGDDNVYSFEN